MKKAFTLVEMLIVIIIIGILIAALFPKLKWAQAAARDTSRQIALGNIWTALFQYQSDVWEYPTGSCTDDLKDDLSKYITTMPTDPQAKRIAYGTKSNGCKNGNFAYTSLYNAWSENAWYVLVANTESEGKKSNFVLPDTTKVLFTWSSSSYVSENLWTSSSNQSNLESVSTALNDSSKRSVSNNKNAKIYDSRVIPLLSCREGVEISASWSWNICLDGVENKGKTTSSASMVYVVSK